MGWRRISTNASCLATPSTNLASHTQNSGAVMVTILKVPCQCTFIISCPSMTRKDAVLVSPQDCVQSPRKRQKTPSQTRRASGSPSTRIARSQGRCVGGRKGQRLQFSDEREEEFLRIRSNFWLRAK